jgi:hypothetical protein
VPQVQKSERRRKAKENEGEMKKEVGNSGRRERELPGATGVAFCSTSLCCFDHRRQIIGNHKAFRARHNTAPEEEATQPNTVRREKEIQSKMNMNTLLKDFVSDLEGYAEQQQQSTTSSASPGLDRKRKVDHDEAAFVDEAAPAVPPSNGDGDAGKMNHLKKSPESDDNDSDHRGRKAVKSGNNQDDDDEQEDSSSSTSTSTSPNDSGLDKPTEGEDQDEDDEVAEDDEADAPTARSREEPTDAQPPSPPPLPLHRHRPSAGARRTFDNLMADAADSSPSSTHRSTVIAAVVVFDGEGRVLLVQEAKPKCRGLWYLPGTCAHVWGVCGGACVVRWCVCAVVC